MAFELKFRLPVGFTALAMAALVTLPTTRADAEALLLIEAETGRVLHAENAGHPWYPASLTKVMTTYLVLDAIRRGRITLDTLLTVSENAASQAPSKMGFKPGTRVTVDNAIKMMMVKSANDIAVVVAENLSGSVEKFADEMNAVSRRLGMSQSRWVNPHGLPDDGQVSSARDVAILAQAIIRDFPEYESYWRIPAIRHGKVLMRNHNTLIGRYDGADGMKTGFICSAGFNLVASASRNGKRLIAVVLGQPSSPVRGARAADLLERGFGSGGIGGGIVSLFRPSLGNVATLQPVAAAPPDLREDMCGKNRRRPAAEELDEELIGAEGPDTAPVRAFQLSSLPPSSVKPSSLIGPPVRIANPVVVHVGPSKRSAQAKIAATNRPPAAAPRPGQIAATDGQSDRAAQGLPAIAGAASASLLSFAPLATAQPAPLTAMPRARPEAQQVLLPMPRPRPRTAARRR